MTRLRPLTLLLLAGCGTPEREPTLRPVQPKSGEPRIVAFLDGDPISWEQVSEKLIDLDLRRCVDLYLRWRILEEEKRRNGIAHSAGDLRARAEAFVRDYKARQGEATFHRQLRERGMTESAYRDSLSGNRLFREKLTLEKLVWHTYLREGWMELDRLAFVSDEDARNFVAAVKSKGFDRAADSLAPSRGRVSRQPRETVCRVLPPRELDGKILERLSRMKAGETTEPIAAAGGLLLVIHVRASHPPEPESYSVLKERVLASILKSPPSDRELLAWIHWRMKRSKIEYANRNPQGD